MAYFLISVSNRKNLELCKEHKLAGFTNSINGFWTFVEIEEGDYISFLYGARAHNLYRVVRKMALKNAEKYGPWEPITFRSGYTYYFPFRLQLSLVREFDEPMVRQEFAYVAENLLLRGGYRKTHFQADEITFYQVSQMGKSVDANETNGELYPTEELFVPKITFDIRRKAPPEVFPFREVILQSLIRKFLEGTPEVLGNILSRLEIDDDPKEFEVLGEKALPEGHVDIFIKKRHPRGVSPKIVVEVKKGAARKEDIEQLARYMDELGNECAGGVLIAKSFSRRLPNPPQDMLFLSYRFEDVDKGELYTYEELLDRFALVFP